MIREVHSLDAEDMAELMGQLHPSEKAQTAEIIRSKILKMSQLDHIKIFGYELESKVVGTCTLAKVEGLSHGCRPFAIIENVVTLESTRGKGIGKKLLRYAIDQAEKWDCYKVILETGTRDEWKLKFYESCGLRRGSKTAFIKRF